MDERITLRAGPLEAELAPSHGGRLSALRRMQDGTRIDIVPPLGAWEAAPREWPKQGGYPLLPYSNRIGQSALVVAGRRIALRPHHGALPHTLHGPAHLRPWRVTAATEDQATLALDYAPDADWPWPFHAEQALALTPDGLTLSLSLRNDAGEATPAGIGWHPYLTCRDDSLMQHDAKRLWPHDSDHVATGESRPPTEDAEDTAYLSEWSRAALIHPDGSGVEITADTALGHLVLHRPRGAGYACIEPVSHVSNGFNLAAAGIGGTGTITLQPGQTLRGTVRLALLPGHPAAQTR